MKRRFLQLVCVALGMCSLNAQNSFFEPTDYAGALSPDAASDWTKTGWTNFDPKNANYSIPNETTTLAAGNGVINITSAVTLDPAKTYLLSGIVAVKEGGSLTIPAGTVIRGYRDVDASANTSSYCLIIVERGGKIFVNGTASAPVVMTSNAPAGQRDRGDWAGLVILGKSRTNQVAPQLEGFSKLTTYLAGAGGVFGGNDDADNSGVLSHLRIEFAGTALDVNKEINALTLAGVGAGTTIDYVQCSFSNDDSFEWFGGNVNAKHLIAFCGTDDDFDTDFGYRGNVQFAIGLKHPSYYDMTYADPQGSSTSEGFESDNDATGSNNKPYTSAIFSNCTMVGPISFDSTYASTKSSTTKNAFRRGARLRRNTKQSIVKSIFTGYRNFVMVDGPAALANYGVLATPQVFKTDSAMFYGNVFVNTAATSQLSLTSKASNGLAEIANVNTGGAPDTSINGPELRRLDAWLRNPSNKSIINNVAFSAGTFLVDPQNFTNPDFRPVSITVVGLSDVTYDATLGVYPNPVAQEENLYISDLEQSYLLMSTQGRILMSGVGTKIAIGKVNKGIYILQVGAKSTKVVVE